jgi:hypothetical protein
MTQQEAKDCAWATWRAAAVTERGHGIEARVSEDIDRVRFERWWRANKSRLPGFRRGGCG